MTGTGAILHDARRLLHQVRRILTACADASPSDAIWGEVRALDEEVARLSDVAMEAACAARGGVVPPEPVAPRTICPYCGDPVVTSRVGRRTLPGNEYCGKHACGFKQQRARIMATGIDPGEEATWPV